MNVQAVISNTETRRAFIAQGKNTRGQRCLENPRTRRLAGQADRLTTFGRLERQIKGNLLYDRRTTWWIGYSF